jgi:membrane protein implicated in regulation of membrane protease activity
MRRESWRLIVFTAVFAMTVWAAMPGMAQMRRQSPMYNPATEATVKGSVAEVIQVKGPGRWGGTHLTLKTDKESIDVHVGPSWYLAQNKISFAKGDQVEVTGSRVKFGDKDALIAREIKKGSETFTLRNSQGIPAWSRGRRGPVS